MSKTFVFIDGSYFIFYRYYALVQWWKASHKDEELSDPINKPEFVEKFKSTFVSKLKEISKKLKLENVMMFVGKDCPRQDIWRMALHPEYKGTRVNDGFEGGPFFKMAYREKLFEAGGAHMILSHPKLEADDCIAISAKNTLLSYPEETSKVVIIASDHDYLQLVGPRLSIFSLKYKNLLESKKAYNSAEKNLFFKIVLGDKSDNIPGMFKKCGPKTAEKYYDDKNLFMDKCKSANAGDRFELNNRLVNFNEIPSDLVDEFMVQNWLE